MMESCGCGFWAGFGGGGGGGGRAGSAAEPAPSSVLLPTPASVLLSSSTTSIGSPAPGTSAILSETKRELEGDEGTPRQRASAFNCWPKERQGTVQPMDAADFKNGPRLPVDAGRGAQVQCTTIRDDLLKNNPTTT